MNGALVEGATPVEGATLEISERSTTMPLLMEPSSNSIDSLKIDRLYRKRSIFIENKPFTSVWGENKIDDFVYLYRHYAEYKRTLSVFNFCLKIKFWVFIYDFFFKKFHI